MNFWIAQLICIFIQLAGFLPFYLIWRRDCKRIGKDNLAVPLKKRLSLWWLCCPIWVVPMLSLLR